MQRVWQELKNQWRVMDGVVIISLILCSFIPSIIFWWSQTSQDSDQGTIAIVSIKGKEVDRFDLSQNQQFEKTYYPAKGQYNIIEVDGDRIRDREDNSPDQIAVKTGWISRPGQTSICLPHQLVIEIKSKHPEEVDDMIISY